MSVRIYQYGSSSKMTVSGQAENQLRLQISFWNELVGLDREFAQRYRQMTNNANETIASLNKQVDNKKDELVTLREEIKKKRIKLKSGKADDSAVKQKVTTLVKDIKLLIGELRACRSEVMIMLKPRLSDLEAERRDRVKKLRREFAARGLYWGNYNAVLGSYQTARKRILQSGGELHFHSYDGAGRWTCQIQGAMTVDEAFSRANNLFQIDPVPEDAWSRPAKGERKRLCRTVARMRIASDEGSNPVWLEIPIVMHRPIPQDAKIPLVSINAEKVGGAMRWFLNVTVIEEEPQKEHSPSGRILAVNIGCREKPDGSIRVACWVDNKEAAGEVSLDRSFVTTDARINTLQKKRDDNFNLAKERLAQWLSKAGGNGDEPPRWLLQKANAPGQWKAQSRLAALTLYWRENRFDGDDQIFQLLENWRRQDKHLWIWQANLRDKMRGRRLEQYRVFAAKTAATYDTVIFGKLDLGRSGERRRTAGEDDGSDRRNLMNIAGLSILKAEIKRAFHAAGKLIVENDSSGITEECPFCGKMTENGHTAKILLSCGNCGNVYDPDRAGAKKLLSSEVSTIKRS